MIEWFATKDKLPETKGQECILYSDKTGAVAAPVPWMPYEDGGGMWVDLFATPEAGSAYTTDIVTHWAIWNGPENGANNEQQERNAG